MTLKLFYIFLYVNFIITIFYFSLYNLQLKKYPIIMKNKKMWFSKFYHIIFSNKKIIENNSNKKNNKKQGLYIEKYVHRLRNMWNLSEFKETVAERKETSTMLCGIDVPVDQGRLRHWGIKI
jgi:hypothetical protein